MIAFSDFFFKFLACKNIQEDSLSHSATCTYIVLTMGMRKYISRKPFVTFLIFVLYSQDVLLRILHVLEVEYSVCSFWKIITHYILIHKTGTILLETFDPEFQIRNMQFNFHHRYISVDLLL